MPKLRRLSGSEVITILQRYGFEVIRIRDSHHRRRRTVEGKNQFLSVPVHGKGSLTTTTLRSIYRQALQHIPEDDLREDFYTD